MDPNQSLDINEGGINNEDKSLLNTLDETKRESLKRELRSIIQKMKVALFPMKQGNSKSLQDWDFWGPLLLCLVLGLVLSWQKHDENTGIVFIMIFGIMWVGGLIVSLNSQFLGVNFNIFQCICILGYCTFAIVLASIINLFLFFLPVFVRVIISFCGSFYSIYGMLYFF